MPRSSPLPRPTGPGWIVALLGLAAGVACDPAPLDGAGEDSSPGGGATAGDDDEGGGVRLVDASETLPGPPEAAKRRTAVFVENGVPVDLLLTWYDSDGEWDGDSFFLSGLPLRPGERTRVDVELDTVQVQATADDGACAQSPVYVLSPGDVREWLVERLPGRDGGGMRCE